MPVIAPEFPDHSKWINTSFPLSLESLKGQPILLCFWTFSSVNSINIIEELKKIENEFTKRGLAIISIHQPKFQHEFNFINIKEACIRLKIEHSVVVDEKMSIWKNFALKNTPAFVLIDCDGSIFFSITGEYKFDILLEQINQLFQDKNFPEIGLINSEKYDDKFMFRYPTKTVASKIENSLFYFVTDTYNNRVVQLNHEGNFVTFFGECDLLSPLGCCIWKDELVVCDTGHNRVVAFDLNPNKHKKFRVLAGKGEHSIFESRAEYDAKLAPLSSPTDVCVWGNNLAITCSGSHQIVLYVPKDDAVIHLAGAGKEDVLDGPAAFACLAQPTGISAISDTVLAFTDSNSSSVRLLVKNWNDTGKTMIMSLVSSGLFDSGFVDGLGAEAKMQYPLSCAWSSQSQNLYILDSYNNALRSYSIGKDYMGTIILSEKLNEPSGLFWFEGLLIITDKNSHRIIIIRESDIINKENMNSTEIFQIFAIYQGPFSRITDYPKNMIPNNLV
ncbi:hypothetical protein [Spirobacillus cienkowskii]|uniref:hypothetical protein n=1 Tax=Spirobacillus cienkowskii TaxID=495820 RepID=UPI0030CAAE05